MTINIRVLTLNKIQNCILRKNLPEGARMDNKLRVALKHLMEADDTVSTITHLNFQAVRRAFCPTPEILIYHLKFKGYQKLLICNWDIAEKEIILNEKSACFPQEVIFIIRTVKKLGYSINKIYTVPSNINYISEKSQWKDVTQDYLTYL